MALARRGDVRVLAVDAAHHGSSFVQRLERAEVDSELVPTEAAAIAAASADVVLIEAEALDSTLIVAATGSAVVAAAAGLAATPVWCVAGCGRRLPSPMVTGDRRAGRSAGRRPVDARGGDAAGVARGPRRRTARSDDGGGCPRRVRDGARTAAHRDHVGTFRRWPVDRDQIIMSDEEIAAFLDEERVLNVATIGPTGHPHVVAMWYAVVDGRPAFWTFGKSQKVRQPAPRPEDHRARRGRRLVPRAPRRRAGRHRPARRGLRRDPRDRPAGLRPVRRRRVDQRVPRSAGAQARRCRHRRRAHRQLGPPQAPRRLLTRFGQHPGDGPSPDT